jgi:hypothetical protein
LKSIAQLNNFIEYNLAKFHQVKKLKSSVASLAYQNPAFQLSNNKPAVARVDVLNNTGIPTMNIYFTDKDDWIGGAALNLRPDVTMLNALSIEPGYRQTELRQLIDLMGLQVGRLVNQKARKLQLESTKKALPANYRAGYRYTGLPLRHVVGAKNMIKRLNEGERLSAQELSQQKTRFPLMQLSHKVMHQYEALPCVIPSDIQIQLKTLFKGN